MSNTLGRKYIFYFFIDLNYVLNEKMCKLLRNTKAFLMSFNEIFPSLFRSFKLKLITVHFYIFMQIRIITKIKENF